MRCQQLVEKRSRKYLGRINKMVKEESENSFICGGKFEVTTYRRSCHCCGDDLNIEYQCYDCGSKYIDLNGAYFYDEEVLEAAFEYIISQLPYGSFERMEYYDKIKMLALLNAQR